MSNKIDLNFEQYQGEYLYKNIVKEVESFRIFCDNLDERSKKLLSFINFMDIDALENNIYYSDITFLEKVLDCIDKKVVYHCNGRDYENTILLMKAFVSENRITKSEFKERYSIYTVFFTKEITSYIMLERLSKLANDFEIKVVDK